MPVINKSPFPKTDKMGRKVPDGEAKFIDKHETETIVRDEKTGTASDDTFQAKNIPVTNYKRQSAMTYEEAAVNKVLRIHKNIAFDSKVNEYLQISEEKMTAKQKEKREEIVMSMKDKENEFKKKYGKRAKEVMYATATKMAMEGYIVEGPTGVGGRDRPGAAGGVTLRPPTSPVPEPEEDNRSQEEIDMQQLNNPNGVAADINRERAYKGSAGAQAIQKANPNAIKNVNQIRAGQVIKVNGTDYTVKAGDTLDKIARNNPAPVQTPAGSAHSAPQQRNTAGTYGRNNSPVTTTAPPLPPKNPGQGNPTPKSTTPIGDALNARATQRGR